MADLTTADLMTLIQNANSGLSDAITAYAMRPQKSSVFTNTVTTDRPYALENMIANRDRIGTATQELDDALAGRESYKYRFGRGLSNITPTDGAGSWLSGTLRAFGGGLTGGTDLFTDRQKQKYDNTMNDLATILAYDKAMGSTQNTTQSQTIGYDNMPWGGVAGKGKGQQQGVGPKDIVNTENTATNLGDLYQTIDANPQAFSATGGLKQDAVSTGLKSGVDVMGVDAMGKREFQYLQSIMPQGFATTINTAKEQEVMRPYTTKFHNGRGSEKKASIKGMLGSIYDAYAADAAAQGFQMPITREQYIQSRIDAGREINAEWFSKPDVPMYKVNPVVQERQQQQEQTKKNYMQFLEGTL